MYVIMVSVTDLIKPLEFLGAETNLGLVDFQSIDRTITARLQTMGFQSLQDFDIGKIVVEY